MNWRKYAIQLEAERDGALNQVDIAYAQIRKLTAELTALQKRYDELSNPQDFLFESQQCEHGEYKGLCPKCNPQCNGKCQGSPSEFAPYSGWSPDLNCPKHGRSSL